MKKARMKEIEISPEEIEKLPDNSKFAPKYIPIEKILELKGKNLSSSQIAKLLNCHSSAIRARLTDHCYMAENLESFKNHRPDLLAMHQSQILSNVATAKVKPPRTVRDLKDAVTAFGILYDKERLERGMSTDIVDHNVLVNHVFQVDLEIRRIEDELKRIGQSGGPGEVVDV
jgi:hypothetical protein